MRFIICILFELIMWKVQPVKRFQALVTFFLCTDIAVHTPFINEEYRAGMALLPQICLVY